MSAELRELLDERSAVQADLTLADIRLAGIRRRVSRHRFLRRAGGLGLTLAAVAILITGYAVTASPRLGGHPGPGIGVNGGPSEESLRQRANDALARWDAAIKAAGGQPYFLIPASNQTNQIGDWEKPVGNNNKMALMSGMVVAAVPLTATVPPTAEIRWPDGTTRTLPTVSATKALEMLTAESTNGQSCRECVPLQVIGARLSTGEIDTSRGRATIPVWEYTLSGTAVRITQAAIDISKGVNLGLPPWDPEPLAIYVDSASGRINGLDLTVNFVGAPADQGACGAEYTAEAVESANAIVVIVIEHPHAADYPRDAHIACAMMGHQRTASVRLASPLGDRAVLEVQQGMPVPLTLNTN